MEKIQKLRESFQRLGIDGMLVTSDYNRRYMTGFTGSAGMVLISAEKALFITDFRYTEQAAKQCEGYEVVLHKGLIQDEVAEQAKKLGIKKLGFEENHVTYSAYKTFDKGVEAELVPVSGEIEKLRLIKTDSEIKILKEAAAIADALPTSA